MVRNARWGADTHDLAVAAGKQAEKMNSMSDAADKIRQAAEGMVTQEQRIADNAQKSLDASNRQSKAALDSSIAAFRLEQRAWVGVSAASLVQFEPDKPIRIDVAFLNTGKTPALRAYASNGYALSRAYLKEPPSTSIAQIEKILPTKPVHSLPPNGTFIAPLGLQPSAGPSAAPEEWASYNILRESYPAIKDRVQMLYVFGEYRYRDINNRPHTTKFCLFISDPDAKQLQFCEGFNEMD
jgi:hypothetical protein